MWWKDAAAIRAPSKRVRVCWGALGAGTYSEAAHTHRPTLATCTLQFLTFFSFCNLRVAVRLNAIITRTVRRLAVTPFHLPIPHAKAAALPPCWKHNKHQQNQQNQQKQTKTNKNKKMWIWRVQRNTRRAGRWWLHPCTATTRFQSGYWRLTWPPPWCDPQAVLSSTIIHSSATGCRSTTVHSSTAVCRFRGSTQQYQIVDAMQCTALCCVLCAYGKVLGQWRVHAVCARHGKNKQDE